MAHAIAPLFDGYDPKSPRDVLALVNTNAIMSSLACQLQGECQEVLELGMRLTALTSLALGRDDFDCFGEGLRVNQLLKSHFDAGELMLLHRREIRSTIGGEPQTKADGLLQPRYSVRCAPQVFGNASDLLSFAQSKIVEEAFSVSDNPIILPGKDQGSAQIWHGGLFYSAGLSTAADLMLDVVHRVCELSDRQTFLLVDSSLSGGLLNNLALSAADHLKGIHQLSNSLMQTLRAHTTPSRTLSTPAEGYNQDIVPGSMSALLQLQRALQIGRDVLRCGHFIAERGVHFRYGIPVPEKLQLKKWSEYSVV
jgi:histidine ammonia-lyase